MPQAESHDKGKNKGKQNKRYIQAPYPLSDPYLPKENANNDHTHQKNASHLIPSSSTTGDFVAKQAAGFDTVPGLALSISPYLTAPAH